jgi:hypothetical protein
MGISRYALKHASPADGKKPNVGTKGGKYAAFFDTSMKPLGCLTRAGHGRFYNHINRIGS